MTIEEAIAHGREQLDVFGGEHAEFIKLSIEALEKQIPKKVDEDGWGWNECTVCHNRGDNLLSSKFMWCPYCGQKLDWSEGE